MGSVLHLTPWAPVGRSVMPAQHGDHLFREARPFFFAGARRTRTHARARTGVTTPPAPWQLDMGVLVHTKALAPWGAPQGLGSCGRTTGARPMARGGAPCATGARPVGDARAPQGRASHGPVRQGGLAPGPVHQGGRPLCPVHQGGSPHGGLQGPWGRAPGGRGSWGWVRGILVVVPRE